MGQSAAGMEALGIWLPGPMGESPRRPCSLRRPPRRGAARAACARSSAGARIAGRVSAPSPLCRPDAECPALLPGGWTAGARRGAAGGVWGRAGVVPRAGRFVLCSGCAPRWMLGALANGRENSRAAGRFSARAAEINVARIPRPGITSHDAPVTCKPAHASASLLQRGPTEADSASRRNRFLHLCRLGTLRKQSKKIPTQ